jgi:hypothetical protein
MSAGSVLLVTTVPLEGEDAQRILAGADLAGRSVRVLAPSVNDSRLAFWVSDPDEAIAEAQDAASATAAEIDRSDARLDGVQAGESDPLLAIRDALDDEPADEIVVAYRTGEDAAYREDRLEPASLEREFGLPVRAFEVS